jgi:acyl-CoA synthetase (AMP-forming)/AMP-acid ligase II
MYMNASDFLVQNANRYPHRTAVIYRGQQYTYEEINKSVNRLANSLTELGVTKGDRVAFLFNNSNQFYETFYATLKLGAVAVPLNFRMVSREVKWILDNSGAKVLIYSDAFSSIMDPVKNDLATVQKMVCSGKTAAANEFHFEDLCLRGGTEEPNVNVDIDDWCQIQYTGGTTGVPKGAILTHGCVIFASLASIIRFHLSDSSEVFVNQLPMFHIAGLQMMMFCLATAGTFVIIETFDPQEILRLIEQEKATFLFLMPPATYIRLLNTPDLERFDTSSVRTIGTAAGALSPSLVLRLFDTFPNAKLTYGWACTEAVGGINNIITRNMVESDPERLKSIGTPIPCTNIRLVDDAGREVPQGEAGEVIVKGPQTMIGYLDQPELTAQAIRDGWIHTGDLLRKDTDGFYYFADRKKDMIKSGGENVFATEVEGIILSHPAVENCAVIGVPDPVFQEAVMAVVKVVEGKTVTENDIIEHCKKSLSSYKKPRRVAFVDSLPIGPGGKIQKFKLREQYSKSGS